MSETNEEKFRKMYEISWELKRLYESAFYKKIILEMNASDAKYWIANMKMVTETLCGTGGLATNWGWREMPILVSEICPTSEEVKKLAESIVFGKESSTQEILKRGPANRICEITDGHLIENAVISVARERGILGPQQECLFPDLKGCEKITVGSGIRR